MVGQLQYCPTSRLKQKFLKPKRNNIMGNMDGLIVAAITPWLYISFLIIYFTRSFWSELPIKKYNFFSALSFLIGMTILIKFQKNDFMAMLFVSLLPLIIELALVIILIKQQKPLPFKVFVASAIMCICHGMMIWLFLTIGFV